MGMVNKYSWTNNNLYKLKWFLNRLGKILLQVWIWHRLSEPIMLGNLYNNNKWPSNNISKFLSKFPHLNNSIPMWMLLPQFSHNKWLTRKSNRIAAKRGILILLVHKDNLIKFHNSSNRYRDLSKRVEINIGNNKVWGQINLTNNNKIPQYSHINNSKTLLK